MPVETAKCWWLLKIEPNAWAGGKGSCAVCVDLQAVGALEFFGELYSLAKGFGPFLKGVWAGFRERGVLFLVTTSTLPSLQAYAELYALSPLRGSISPWYRVCVVHKYVSRDMTKLWACCVSSYFIVLLVTDGDNLPLSAIKGGKV